MRIIVTPQVDTELQNHIAYITERDPDAAERIRAIIINGTRQLADLPGMGRPGRVAGTRELVIVGTSDLVIYEILADAGYVLHINHGRQQWPRAQ